MHLDKLHLLHKVIGKRIYLEELDEHFEIVKVNNNIFRKKPVEFILKEINREKVKHTC